MTSFSLLLEGIVHLDKLKPKELLKFLKNWNIDQAKFHITEKMDGNYMAIGLDNGSFYLRSKNKTFKSPEEVPNIFFMADFKRYYQLLQTVPWNNIIDKLSKKWGFDFDGNFEIEGEAIPSFDHNIVIYDEAKIGDGIFVIFNTKLSAGKGREGTMQMPEMWSDLASEINKHGKVKFFAVPEISIDDLSFDNKLILDLEALIEKHGNFLAQPARTDSQKELKSKLLAKIADIGQRVKKQALKHPVVGKFGTEIEGVVITDADGNLVKIVDTSKFSARKESNWHFINMLINAERDFTKSVKLAPKNLAQHLEFWEDIVKAIAKDYEKNADKYITIEKKKFDTENGIDFALQVIKTMRQSLKRGQKPEKIVDDFLNKRIIPEGTKVASLKKQLIEGGRALQGANTAVPRDLVIPTVEGALESIGLDGASYNLVGNWKKPFANDIDVAIDIRDIANKISLTKIETEESFWKVLERHLSKSGVKDYSIIKGFKQFHVLAPLVDSSGGQLLSFNLDGSRGDQSGMVQIDVFVGNIEWIKKINSGSPDTSKYKAKYRNLLLASIAATVKWQEPDDQRGEYHRYVINLRDGLKQQRRKTVTDNKGRKKQEKVAEVLISTNADDLAKILFGKGVLWKDIDSFEELYVLLKSPKFKYAKFTEQIIDDFKAALQKNGWEIPDELR